ncbi:MAG: FG-GAP repeat protein, partial [Planctomycetes bacterium]|nr:FG-GAP repeat protein [Planctomycetota bacterium]
DDRWVEEARLVPSDGAFGDGFGIVSLGAGRAVVGAVGHDDGCPVDFYTGKVEDCNTGAAYVFRHEDSGTPLDPSDDVWVEETKLRASDADEFDRFGGAVAIHGGRLLVGAPFAVGLDSGSGAAYVFRLDDNSTPGDLRDDFWAQEVKLFTSQSVPFGMFGTSVSLGAVHAVIGAFAADIAGGNSGAGYVFRLDDGETPSDPSDDFWVEQQQLLGSDTSSGDFFGLSIALSGNWIIAGARLNDDAGNASGSAYVFRLDDCGTPADSGDDRWVQAFKFTASDASRDDHFGSSVAIDGAMAIVGAFIDDDACPEDRFCDSGSAYVFSFDRPCVGLIDYAQLQNCFAGDEGIEPGCEGFDLNGDGKVDISDVREFLFMLGGP